MGWDIVLKRILKFKVSIRYQVTVYFLIVITAMVAVLGLFQTIFLDDFYNSSMLNELNSCSESIISNINNENLEELVDEISTVNLFTVHIFKVEGKNDFSIYYKAEGFRSYYNYFTSDNINGYYHAARRKGGSDIINFPTSINEITDFEAVTTNQDEYVSKSIIHSSIVKDKDGQEYLVLLNTIIDPMNTTTRTLSDQLTIIALVFIIMGSLISFMMSRIISAPIENINSCAKELAKGNYKIKFIDTGYREVEELSSTLNYAAEELRKTEHLQNELIANVSHDLRTPLTMISGYAELMRDIPGENTSENCQIIIDEANRLSRFVTDLLDISKMQANVSTITREEFNITQTLTEILQSYSSLSKQRGLIIKFEYDSEITVNADKSKISQVVYNLVNNAVNYCGEDKTVIVKQIIKDSAVRIEIIDHGRGIPKEEINNIWDRYYKVDREHRTAVVGTGLGLSIVKSILELHCARYGVDSDLGKGSTFYFELDKII